MRAGRCLALEVVGPRKLAESTAFTALDWCVKLAIRCIVCLDRLGYDWWGARDTAATEAAWSEQRKRSNQDSALISFMELDIITL